MSTKNQQVTVLKQRSETLRSSLRAITKTLAAVELSLYMEQLKQRAWELYCEETRGDLDVRDHWDDLPAVVQRMFINRVRNPERLNALDSR